MTNQSESIAALAAALAKAQSVMEGAKKDSANPFFQSKYSDLSAVWDACRKPLTDNGLSVIQTAGFLPEHPDMVCIETILCHSSGEWVRGRLAVKPVKGDPQSVGSCITYLRRYSLQSMVGIAPEDDDGNAASGQGDAKRETKKPAPKPPATQPADATQAEKTRKRMEILLKEANLPRDLFKEWLVSVGWIDPMPDGSLSMTALEDKRVQYLVDKWDSAKTTFSAWADKYQGAAQ